MGEKILLYFPNFNLYETISLLAHQPPLALGYLAASLERNGIQYDVLDAAAENLTHNQIIDAIARSNPSIIGITTNIAMKYALLVQSRIIKKRFPHIKLIMGGPLATAEYGMLLTKKYTDVVVLGEGEYTLIDLVKTDELTNEALRAIRGIAFLSKTGVESTGCKEPIGDLDALGHPQWDKFPIYKYTNKTLHRAVPYFPIMTSRGCPYDCINCTKIIHGYTVRSRSVASIIAELEYLKKRFNFQEIIVTDDFFNANLRQAKEILHAVIKFRQQHQFNIQLMNGIRADLVDREFADLAKKAGVYKAGIGIESGSQKVIEFLQKKLDLQKVPEAIRTLRARGIVVDGFFMIGIPVETPSSLIHTIYFADRLDLDVAYFFKLLLFPGTRIYDYVMKHTTILSDYSDSHAVNFYSTPLAFQTEKLQDSDVARALRYSAIRFYCNPRRLFRLLKSLSSRELKYYIRRLVNLGLKKVLAMLQFRS